MRKKTLGALLCTVAAMAVLTGCGGDEKGNGGCTGRGEHHCCSDRGCQDRSRNHSRSSDRGRRRKEPGYAQCQLCSKSESSSGGI